MSINIKAKTDYSSLFNNLNNNSSNGNALTDLSWLSDYSSIKTGTYGKLMKAYYASDASDEVNKTATEKLSVSSEESKAYTKVATSADALQSDIKSIQDIGASGDEEKLYNAVNSYVKDYNALLEDTSKVNDLSISGRIDNIKSLTADNKNELAKLGITIGNDGALKLDKDTFTAADKSGINTLFAKKGSYAYGVSVSAGMAQSTASYDAAKESTYTSTGNYSSVTGTLWDTTT